MGWDEWEQQAVDPVAPLRPAAERRPAEGTEPVAGQSESRSRGGRRRAKRRQRRAARELATAAAQRQHRSYLRDLERAPGIAVLVLAVLVVVVVVIVRMNSDDGDSPAASASGGASTAAASASGTEAETVPVVVDPHASVEVLAPRGMPPSPLDPKDLDRSTATAAGFAFATHACAFLTGESENDYAQRLTALSTSQVAQSWEHGSASRVSCLQLSAAAVSETDAAATVAISGVQVYPGDESGELVAYRWAATVQVAVVDGVWTVTG